MKIKLKLNKKLNKLNKKLNKRKITKTKYFNKETQTIIKNYNTAFQEKQIL